MTSRRHYIACLPLLFVASLAMARPGLANDRDLRATTLPPSACAVTFSSASFTPLAAGAVVINLEGSTVLHCPLPLSNVDLGGATNDNDISKVRVHYRDGDGQGTAASVRVRLWRSVASASQFSGVSNSRLCEWNSNARAATAGTNAMFPCQVDLASGSFYWFEVTLTISEDGGVASFIGIDFPS
jgi:hypothetical protein